MRIGSQIGIWRGKGVAEAIAATGQLGLAGIETFAEHIVPHYEEPEAFGDLLDDAGTALSGVYFNSPQFIDPAGEDEVVRRATEACEFLQEVGAGFLVLNGGIGKREGDAFSDADFRQLATVGNRIGEQSWQLGVQTVIHPHVRCMVEVGADVDRLLAAGLDTDLVGLCVHASHQLLAGADPYAIYEKHASWVRYAHVGDQGADGKGALLGQGTLDQKRLMAPLLAAGYDGWIIIECGKEGVPPEDYAAKARDYLEATWPEVDWE